MRPGDVLLEGAAYPFFVIGWFCGIFAKGVTSVWAFCWGAMVVGYRQARGTKYEHSVTNQETE